MTEIDYDKLEDYCSNLVLLYVEDNKSVRDSTLEVFNEFFSEIVVATNGVEAIELFKENSSINIVITDIDMPKLNGLDAIEGMLKIRKNFISIVLSAHEETSFLKRGYEVGVHDYLIKPLNLEEFNKTIINVSGKIEFLNSGYNLFERTFQDLSTTISRGEFKYLAVLDIVNFSIINKMHGKDFGDKLLFNLNSIFKEFEDNDILLFKIDSDKFVFTLKESDTNKIHKFIESLNYRFESDILFENELIDINFNIGLSHINSDLNSVLNAEYALEQVKNDNLSNFAFYDEEDSAIKRNKESAKWFKITKNLIKNKDIKPVFQPIVDFNTGKVSKYEVLARGIFEGRDIAPFFFIPAAEKLGLISEITKIIIEKSFKFFSNTDINFTINISGEDLKDNFLEFFLQDKCKLFGIKHNNVTLEILENITIDSDNDIIIFQITRLKELGFNIAIDDFGADNSNFSRLLDIDCDILKIDMLFIKNIDKNLKYQLIVKAIVNLAKTLGMKTVAEYVENKKIYDIVKECGVDYAQGYYIGKPESFILSEEFNVKDLF